MFLKYDDTVHPCLQLHIQLLSLLIKHRDGDKSTKSNISAIWFLTEPNGDLHSFPCFYPCLCYQFSTQCSRSALKKRKKNTWIVTSLFKTFQWISAQRKIWSYYNHQWSPIWSGSLLSLWPHLYVHAPSLPPLKLQRPLYCPLAHQAYSSSSGCPHCSIRSGLCTNIINRETFPDLPYKSNSSSQHQAYSPMPLLCFYVPPEHHMTYMYILFSCLLYSRRSSPWQQAFCFVPCCMSSS